MSDKNKGLYQKYRVTKLVERPGNDWAEESVGWVFVLNPATDPGAVSALKAYIDWAWEAGYDRLATDLERKLVELGKAN